MHTVGEGLLPEGCGEGTVDHGDRAAEGAELVEVHDAEYGVGRCLGEDQHRATGLHRRGERTGSRAVHEGDVDPEAGARPLQEGEGGRVEVVLGDDVIALAAEGEYDGCDRSHAAGEGECSFGAFEIGDGFLERPDRRVGVAAVELVGAGAGGAPAGVGHVAALPDGAGPQGGRQ